MLIAAGMDNWNYWKIMPQLVTIVITTVFIVTISFIYSRKVKKMKSDDDPRGIVLVVELIVKYIEKMVIEVLGVKYKNLTVYLMYLILYILIGNWLSIIGLESPASTYTVTLSLALVTFIGIYYVGIKFQKLVFFKKYINPIELITQFAPLISLSFRLFGNIMGGAIILSLLYGVTGQIWAKIPIIGQANFLIGGIAPFLHMYFDLFAGSIQALIFGMLTIVYWKLQMVTDQKSEVEIKLPKKYRKKHKQSHLTEILENEREFLDRFLKEKK
ncbi:F0F1 ATP synthase subunit A [Spiroplasma platyhelix]|uniref:F0F1 ATP synthase subunit A n=1 Tax=Spiroplasma platyhelix PALS-1 TaxID=1276218 RepID=A0A846U257_9MOLU|nr:F0F1 ATP synthase subunit A [Spiroplasma platyhelix]MBE4704226.1 ATP synthase subunit a [Spiroplasma platyhelix PALS-1]NKE38599.1 F0F1 ATP synthase subunit A [Spiroplasma platyhelix PALS-1]UJB28810.1 F0F1 ATP synthase subunit A [Spiroplasma platyhelix PALS-1]